MPPIFLCFMVYYVATIITILHVQCTLYMLQVDIGVHTWCVYIVMRPNIIVIICRVICLMNKMDLGLV